MKLVERGRGKFKPAPNYTIDDVKHLLFQKIAAEKTFNEDNLNSIDINTNNLYYQNDKFNMLSLFCGCGGLDLGFELAGLSAVVGKNEALKTFYDKESYNQVRHKSIFNKVLSTDFFKEALESYEKNFPSHTQILNEDIKNIRTFPKANIVLGGFPCPGFSEAGPRLIDDPRNFLYLHFIRCLLQSKPEVFVAENVKGMLTLGKGEVFKQIVEDFSAAGYRVYHKLVNARDYGVPQIRERVFLIGIREDIDFEYKFPNKTHGEELGLLPFVTLQEAIGDLEFNPGAYFTGSYSSIFMSRNRKKRWHDQSFTIQASGRQAPIHPGGFPMEKLSENNWAFAEGEENNRRLSVKEIARIQTFPDWYYFSDGSSSNKKASENYYLDKIYKQIGNAVPVLLAMEIALPIAEWAVRHLKPKDSYTQIELFL